MRDGIAKPWAVISPSAGPVASGAFFNSPDRLWCAVADRLVSRGLRDVPDRLARSLTPAQAWSSPGLLLGQICTRPLEREHPQLRVLAHPVYAVPDRAGFHHSLIVVPAGSGLSDLADLRGATAAINDPGSNTGVALLYDTIARVTTDPLFLGSVVETGSHRSSVIAVGEGRADVAAIDIVTWSAIARHEPHLTARLRTIARSRSAPTPPFVTARETPVETVRVVRAVLAEAFADPTLAVMRRELDLTGLVPLATATGSVAEHAA